MYWWETSLTPVAVGLQSNGPYWTVRTAHKRCKQSDDKFPGSKSKHDPWDVLVPWRLHPKRCSTRHNQTAPKERCFQALTDQNQVWSTVGPSWIGPGPAEGRADTDLLVEPLPSQREHRPWAELCNETCWSVYIFILKKTFNDPNVGGPFTKRKQSDARV